MYVLEFEHGIKIGWTSQPAKRLAALESQFGSHYLWAMLPGTRTLETWLHLKYVAHSTGGDWFRTDVEILRDADEGRLLDRPGGLTKYRRLALVYGTSA